MIAGNAGVLVSRVLYTKQSGEKRFLIQDAAMNDLIRPALYESFHRIWPVDVPAGFPAPPDDYEAAHPRGRALGRGRPGLRERRLPGQGPPAPRWAAATCSPSSRPALTAWSWPRITTPAPAPPRSSSKARAARLVRRRETYEDLVAQEMARLRHDRSGDVRSTRRRLNAGPEPDAPNAVRPLAKRERSPGHPPCRERGPGRGFDAWSSRPVWSAAMAPGSRRAAAGAGGVRQDADDPAGTLGRGRLPRADRAGARACRI